MATTLGLSLAAVLFGESYAVGYLFESGWPSLSAVAGTLRRQRTTESVSSVRSQEVYTRQTGNTGPGVRGNQHTCDPAGRGSAVPVQPLDGSPRA